MPETDVWYAVPAARATDRLQVDPAAGLSSAEVERRRAQHGPNRLRETKKEPRWKAFLRQFRDPLILILLVAAVVSLVVTGHLETPIAIAVVVLLNATIGFVQEAKAEASLDALRKMLKTTATVRRDGRVQQIPAEDLVPGDIITVEAGDRVPADARLLVASSLEAQESTLTGEAQPVPKSATAVVREKAALGDRATELFMNTTITRGRGEAVVTATGMETETGKIAGLLHAAKAGATPLQQQIDRLGRTLATVAGLVIVVVFVLGLIRGQRFGDLFVNAVSLAVAAIPEGLPAVVAFTLAMGTGRLARRGAIVKRLASVETLGSTSQICTDKTGTLTLNQMTARELITRGRRFTVSGEGYATDGRIRSTDGLPVGDLEDVLVAMALCGDAVLKDGEIVGDPTEGALVVLAEKGGIDVDELRRSRPRIAEVPFDADYKYMATFHRWGDGVRMFVKGAPDVLARLAGGTLDAANAGLAGRGMRVLAIAVRDLPADVDLSDPGEAVGDLTILGLVAIVDPPRPEARAAIADCHRAGIRVRMITGDHAVTAAAVAADLGIPGEAITGADIDHIEDDDALAERLRDVGVVARVSPDHKIRIVKALQGNGDVVAMTGDGVNDAPALRRADIGVAMGRTGTEVSKEASDVVLTDDNFATIVRAVREGRGVYANIVNFTRFQVATAFAFVITFLIASIAGIAGGAPFTALQILFVNLIMDGPPAMSIGVDPVSPDAMNRPPRDRAEHILSRERIGRILLSATVMVLGTLGVLIWAPGPEPQAGAGTVAGTMAFATFVFFQVFNLLNVRSATRSVFSAATLHNKSAFVASGSVVLLLVMVVQLDVFQDLFTTTDLTSAQWLVSVGVGATILLVGEILKAVLRHRARRRRPSRGVPTTAAAE